MSDWEYERESSYFQIRICEVCNKKSESLKNMIGGIGYMMKRAHVYR